MIYLTYVITYIYIYIYIYICVCVCVYIYIYIYNLSNPGLKDRFLHKHLNKSLSMSKTQNSYS